MKITRGHLQTAASPYKGSLPVEAHRSDSPVAKGDAERLCRGYWLSYSIHPFRLSQQHLQGSHRQ